MLVRLITLAPHTRGGGGGGGGGEEARADMRATATTLALAVACTVADFIGAETSSCLDLGFKSPNCKLCAMVQGFLPNGAEDDLVAECLACCERGSAAFSRAKLLYDRRMLIGAAEGLRTFLENESATDEFADRLSIIEVAGTRPTLLMFSEDDSEGVAQPAEVINIWRWEATTLKQYLLEHLDVKLELKER
jgi:hypothetical protein